MADNEGGGLIYDWQWQLWSRGKDVARVAPLAEHAPQERPLSASPLFSARYGYGWPRDFTLPHVEDEDD